MIFEGFLPAGRPVPAVPKAPDLLNKNIGARLWKQSRAVFVMELSDWIGLNQVSLVTDTSWAVTSSLSGSRGPV